MKKTKEKRERHGQVSVITVPPDPLNPQRKTRYKTECRKSIVPAHLQRVEHDSYEDAVHFATDLSLKIKSGKIKEIADEENYELKKIAEKIKMERVLEISSHGSHLHKKPDWATYFGKETSLEQIFDAGREAIAAAAEVNRALGQAGLQPMSVEQVFKKYRELGKRFAEKKSYPKFSVLIDQYIKFKTGPTGGPAQKPLSKTHQKGIRTQMEYLKNYIGIFSCAEDPDFIAEKIINGTNKEKKKTNPNKGKIWDSQTRLAQISTFVTFGNWLTEEKSKECGWVKNHFKPIRKKYVFTKTEQVETYSAKEVEKLFSVLLEDEFLEMIPYFSFLFFAGCRPEELAHTNDGSRRFNWENMEDWEVESPVTGGILFKVKIFDKTGARKSKGTYDRQADLTANGLAWVDYYCQKKKVPRPTVGKMFFSYRKRTKISKLAGVDWIFDGARHTFASNAHQNVSYQGGVNYWLDKVGHSMAIYRRNYRDIRNPAEVKRFFNITPEKLLKLKKMEAKDGTEKTI